MKTTMTVALAGLLGAACGGGATDYGGRYDTLGGPGVECNFVRESIPGFPGGPRECNPSDARVTMEITNGASDTPHVELSWMGSDGLFVGCRGDATRGEEDGTRTLTLTDATCGPGDPSGWSCQYAPTTIVLRELPREGDEGPIRFLTSATFAPGACTPDHQIGWNSPSFVVRSLARR